MSATRKTSLLHLPVYMDWDKPTYLNDWNNSMQTIDRYAVDTDQRLARVSTGMESLQTAVQQNTGNITDLTATAESLTEGIVTVSQAMSLMQSDLVNINSAVVGLDTRMDDLEAQMQNVGKYPYIKQYTREGAIHYDTNTSAPHKIEIRGNGFLRLMYLSGGILCLSKRNPWIIDGVTIGSDISSGTNIRVNMMESSIGLNPPIHFTSSMDIPWYGNSSSGVGVLFLCYFTENTGSITFV